MKRVRVHSFSDIETEFIERVHRMVWCSFATLDTKNRLRSRILHPIWEASTGWVATRRHSLKESHLAHNPCVSLAYISEVATPVYVDCTAMWDDEQSSKQRIWQMFKSAAPPLGYDPGTIFQSIDSPEYGLLKLTPWRIELFDITGETKVWLR